MSEPLGKNQVTTIWGKGGEGRDAEPKSSPAWGKERYYQEEAFVTTCPRCLSLAH